MARRARVVFAGAIYHVTFRGNARAAIFSDRRDYVRFLESLTERVSRYRVRLYLYVLMRNHVHLLVETPEANLPAFMGSLLTSYATFANLRHGRVGHLTQGRYKSPLVEGEEYLLRLSRYVHQNPVQVGDLTRRPLRERIAALRAYPWSSYPAYAGLAAEEPWVDYAPVQAMTPGPPRSKPAVRYRRFVEAGLAETDAEFKSVLDGADLAIGSESFVSRIRDLHTDATRQRWRREDVAFRREGKRVASARIVAAVCRHFGISADDLRRQRINDHVRPAAAALLVRLGGLTQREVADVLGLSTGAAVCLQLQRLKQPRYAEGQRAADAIVKELSI